MEKNELTPKQKRFCQEYIVDCNATQAALRAGYRNGNIGRQLITKNNVSKKISELGSIISEKLEITTEFLIGELLKNHYAAQRKERIGDSNKSLELLGKLHNLFANKNEVKGTTFEDFLREHYAHRKSISKT